MRECTVNGVHYVHKKGGFWADDDKVSNLEMAERFQLPYSTIATRLQTDMSLYDVLTKPYQNPADPKKADRLSPFCRGWLRKAI